MLQEGDGGGEEGGARRVEEVAEEEKGAYRSSLGNAQLELVLLPLVERAREWTGEQATVLRKSGVLDRARLALRRADNSA